MDLRLPRWSLTAMFHARANEPHQAVTARRTVNPQDRQFGDRRYYSVSIFPGLRACEAIKRFTGARFLSKDAPRLPLAGCRSKRCTCKYVHHCDRRIQARRAADVWAPRVPYVGVDRRKSRGRRASDG